MADNVSPETVRLSFKPSPLLADALSQFYRPESRREAYDSSLRSLASFSIHRYGGRLYTDNNPEEPPMVERRISEFENNHLHYAAGHQIPMVSYLGFRQNDRRDLRIDMRLSPRMIDRQHLYALDDLPLDIRQSTIDVYAEIFPARRELGKAALLSAAENLNSLLQINRTPHQSEYARTHSPLPNPKLYAEVEPRLKYRPELILVPKVPELKPFEYEEY
jgi:hypothetical protein